MSTLRRLVAAAGIGIALTGFGAAAARAEPAPRAQAVRSASPAGAESPSPAPLDRSLLDRYCVTCHNERLLTAGLLLDRVDLDDLGATGGSVRSRSAI